VEGRKGESESGEGCVSPNFAKTAKLGGRLGKVGLSNGKSTFCLIGDWMGWGGLKGEPGSSKRGKDNTGEKRGTLQKSFAQPTFAKKKRGKRGHRGQGGEREP